MPETHNFFGLILKSRVSFFRFFFLFLFLPPELGIWGPPPHFKQQITNCAKENYGLDQTAEFSPSLQKKAFSPNELSTQNWNFSDHKEHWSAFFFLNHGNRYCLGRGLTTETSICLSRDFESRSDTRQTEGGVCLFVQTHFLNYLCVSIRRIELENAALSWFSE